MSWGRWLRVSHAWSIAPQTSKWAVRGVAVVFAILAMLSDSSAEAKKKRTVPSVERLEVDVAILRREADKFGGGFVALQVSSRGFVPPAVSEKGSVWMMFGDLAPWGLAQTPIPEGDTSQSPPLDTSQLQPETPVSIEEQMRAQSQALGLSERAILIGMDAKTQAVWKGERCSNCRVFQRKGVIVASRGLSEGAMEALVASMLAAQGMGEAQQDDWSEAVVRAWPGALARRSARWYTIPDDSERLPVQLYVATDPSGRVEASLKQQMRWFRAEVRAAAYLLAAERAILAGDRQHGSAAASLARQDLDVALSETPAPALWRAKLGFAWTLAHPQDSRGAISMDRALRSANRSLEIRRLALASFIYRGDIEAARKEYATMLALGWSESDIWSAMPLQYDLSSLGIAEMNPTRSENLQSVEATPHEP